MAMNKQALTSDELRGLGRIALSGVLGGAGLQALIETVKRINSKHKEVSKPNEETVDKDTVIKVDSGLDKLGSIIKEGENINLGGIPGGMGIALSVLMPLLGAKGIEELFQARHRSDLKDEILDLNEHRLNLFRKGKVKRTPEEKPDIEAGDKPQDGIDDVMEKENSAVNIKPVSSLITGAPMITALVMFALARHALNKRMPKLKEPELDSSVKPLDLKMVRPESSEPKKDEDQELEPGEGRVVSSSITDAMVMTVLGNKEASEVSGFDDLIHAVADCRFEEITKAAQESADIMFDITEGAKRASTQKLSNEQKYVAVRWLSENPSTREIVKLAAAVEVLDSSSLYSALSAIYPHLEETDMDQVEKVAAFTHDLYMRDTLFKGLGPDDFENYKEASETKDPVSYIESILTRMKQG
jgi:hypothetical protein